MRPNIELQIEELVLHGFTLADRYRIGAVVEQELGRLYAEEGIPSGLSQNVEVLHADGGSFNVAPQSRTKVIGHQIASAVYRSFQR